jgi:hypothetical protein
MVETEAGTVRLVECVAARKNNWELETDWRPQTHGQRAVYEVPLPLWETYLAARAALAEAEAALDIYVEVLHDEGDEFSRFL